MTARSEILRDCRSGVPDFDRAVESSIDFAFSCPGIRALLRLPAEAGVILRNKVPEPIIERICGIGIAGWAAYTMLDILADDDRDHGRIRASWPAATALIHVLHFNLDSLEVGPGSLDRVRNIFFKMEAANFHDCRSLPWDDLSEPSVWKSMGAAVPMLLLLAKSGAGPADLDNCQSYFYHLIAARQLSDDALDWPEDWSKGKNTPVTHMIERVMSSGISDGDLSKAFRTEVRTRVAVLILRHAEMSIEAAGNIRALADVRFLKKPPAFYEKLSTEIIDNSALGRSS